MRSQPCYVRAGHSCDMYSAWKPKDNYDMSASVFAVQFNGFMSLTSSCSGQIPQHGIRTHAVGPFNRRDMVQRGRTVS